MEKITPHLWFDKEAKEAAELYVSAFGGSSRIKSSVSIHDTPSGTADIITVDLLGQEFTLLNAGPIFTPNPSISFHVSCETKEDVDALYEKLSDGGKALMELGTYPFSERYGWVQDKYGVSWQISLATEKKAQRITTSFLFVGDVCGKARDAITKYTNVFKNSRIVNLMPYGPDAAPDTEGTVMYATFTLEGQEFAAMDSAHKHAFGFTEGVSLQVHCDTQEEIDYYWEKLSAVPEAEQCGWLKDEFGVSWQIVPTIMDEMMASGDAEKIAKVTQAFLQMKKFDIAELTRAYES